jgi:hypothetical protein
VNFWDSPNASLSRQAIIGCLDLLEEVCRGYLSQGMAVSTHMWTIRLNLQGLFNEPDDLYDPDRHSLHLKMKAGADLEKKVLRAVRPVRVRKRTQDPVVDKVTDYKSGEKNRVLTPGGLIEIKGVHLRINYDRTDCGFFLVSAQTGAGRPKDRRLEHVHKMTARTVLIGLPQDIQPGEYFLEACKQYADLSRDGRLKEVLRVGGQSTKKSSKD